MIQPAIPPLRRWQTWVWIALGAGVVYLAYLLISGLTTPAAPLGPSGNNMVMRGIVSQGQHGDNGWHFEANSSQISPDGYTTTYQGVHDATFFRRGRAAYRLRADTVTVDSRNQNYSANGNVHVWSTDKALPEELQTDDAYWNQSDQTLTCPTETNFAYHGTKLKTTRLTVNLQSGAAQLGDTAIDYTKPPASPTPIVSAMPLASTAPATPAPSPAH